jgi:hypothetical protein
MMVGTKEQIKDSGDSILVDVLKNPGVAEILKLYDEADKQIRATETALEYVRPRVMYATTDSTLA